ncbi:hypothetical protein VQ056_20935 [Paenibacillus sp. JTLBN-2024]
MARVGADQQRGPAHADYGDRPAARFRRLVGHLRARLPMVTTIAHNIHKGKSPLVFGSKNRHFMG